MVECRWESNGRPVAHTVSTRTRPHSVTPRESVGTEARALQRSPTGKQTLPHSAALSRNLPHFATLCRTLLHSAALCCTLLRLEQEGWRGDAARASVRWLDGACCARRLHPCCVVQVERAHLGVGVRGRVWPSVAACRGWPCLHSATVKHDQPPSVTLFLATPLSAHLGSWVEFNSREPLRLLEKNNARAQRSWEEMTRSE